MTKHENVCQEENKNRRICPYCKREFNTVQNCKRHLEENYCLEYKKILELNDEISKRYDEKIQNAINTNRSIIIDATSVYKDARLFYIQKIFMVWVKLLLGCNITILNLGI